MPIPSVVEVGVSADDVRSVRKWLRGWRLAVLATVAVGMATGLVLAWNSMDDGLFIIHVVTAGPFVAACLFWFLFNDSGGDKTAAEPTGTSEWEVRIRPHFPRNEQPETDLKRQNEGDEA